MAIKEMRSLNFGGPDTYVPVPTDWNQTDETQPDFLKNRPFGQVMTEIMPNTEIVGVISDGTAPVADLDPTLFSENLAEVIVLFDGVGYKCPVNCVDGSIMFGNLSLMESENPNTGEPFVVLAIPQFEMAVIGLEDTEVHTVQMSAKVVKPIDRSYLPDYSYFYVGNVDDNYLYLDSDLTIKATVADVRDAAKKCQISINRYGSIHTPFLVADLLSYAEIVLVHTFTDSKPNYRIVYTAEYTPSAT